MAKLQKLDRHGISLCVQDFTTSTKMLIVGFDWQPKVHGWNWIQQSFLITTYMHRVKCNPNAIAFVSNIKWFSTTPLHLVIVHVSWPKAWILPPKALFWGADNEDLKVVPKSCEHLMLELLCAANPWALPYSLPQHVHWCFNMWALVFLTTSWLVSFWIIHLIVPNVGSIHKVIILEDWSVLLGTLL